MEEGHDREELLTSDRQEAEEDVERRALGIRHNLPRCAPATHSSS